jgi:hypothetical protein
VRASTLGTPSSGAGSPLAGVPVVLCDAEAAVSDLPRLFEALITEAVVEPIVTGLGGHDPLQAMRAPGQDGRPFHADPAATPVIVLEGRAVAGPRLDGEDLDLIGAEYPAERPERGEFIPVDRMESGPTGGAFFRRRWGVGDSSLGYGDDDGCIGSRSRADRR